MANQNHTLCLSFFRPGNFLSFAEILLLFLKHKRNLNLRRSYNFFLRCQAYGGRPIPKFLWYFENNNNDPLLSSDGFQVRKQYEFRETLTKYILVRIRYFIGFQTTVTNPKMLLGKMSKTILLLGYYDKKMS